MIGDEKLKLAEYGNLKTKLGLAILPPFLCSVYVAYWLLCLANDIASKMGVE